jgi:flagellar protein FliO/FliZ
MISDFLKIILPLLLVLVIIFVSGLLIRRLNKSVSGQPTLLSLRATLPLGPRERIVLLEVAGQWLVLGITPGQINTLLNLPAQTISDHHTTPAASDNPAKSWLERHLQARHEN